MMVNIRMFNIILLVLFVRWTSFACILQNSQTRPEAGDTLLPVEISIKHKKLTDNTVELTALLTAKIDEQEKPLQDKDIFFKIESDKVMETGPVRTNSEGIAILKISPDLKMIQKPGEIIKYSATFKGDNSLLNAEAVATVIDIRITMNLIENDTLKQVEIVVVKDSLGKQIPVKQLEVFIGVKRMLSLLPVGENLSTDDNGKLIVDFPADIPGDSLGNLTIIAGVSDNELYGNVEKEVVVKWGVPVDNSLPSLGSGLYSDAAPLWMIILVIALLGGAWVHFLIVIYLIIRIKKAGKVKAPK
jgi:hypothetical protein